MLASVAAVCIALVGGCDDHPAADQRGSHLVTVGIRTDEMNYHAARQIGTNWCWAACMQMVLSLRGVNIEQATIVREALGTVDDAPTDSATVCMQLDRWLAATGTRKAVATIGFGPPPQAMVLESLRTAHPIIVAMQQQGVPVGHAVVITGAVYQDLPSGRIVHSLLIRDPDPSFASTYGKRKLSGEELQSISQYILIHDPA
jgi:hypothetical protein